MHIVNLTLHDIIVVADDVPACEVPPSGLYARVVELVRPGDNLHTDRGAAPTATVSYLPKVIDLPEPVTDTIYIVSRVLASAVRRPDLYFPHDEVRDETGRIIGCRALGQFEARDA